MKSKDFVKFMLRGTFVGSPLIIIYLLYEKWKREWDISAIALIFIGIILGLVLYFIYFLIFALPQIKRITNAQKIIENEGYSERFFYEQNRAISKAKSTSARAFLLLILANGYSQTGNLPMAFSTIKQIDVSNFKETGFVCYYNDLLYYYLQAGDIVNAEKIYPTAKPLIEKYIKNPKYAGMLHTLAVREYMVGNYQQSLGMLQNIISAAQKDSSTFGVAKLDMGRVYIKLGDLEKARELLMEVPKTLKTDYSYWQAQQLLAEISGVEINS